MSTLDPELLGILVCPLSKAKLVEFESKLVSTDRATRRAYTIVEGIPDLMIAHSQELPEAEWERIIKITSQV